MPPVTPVTSPVPDTVALALPALHDPPGTASLSVTDVPAHKLSGPDIVPGSGNAFTIIVVVAEMEPHALVTV